MGRSTFGSHLRQGRFADASSKLKCGGGRQCSSDKEALFSGLNTNESIVAGWRV